MLLLDGALRLYSMTQFFMKYKITDDIDAKEVAFVKYVYI
jgi:hypothetical protein